METFVIRSAAARHVLRALSMAAVVCAACLAGLCAPAECAHADDNAPGGRGLAVLGGTEGEDWTYKDGVLKIKSSLDAPIVVSMAEGVDTTSDRIVVWNDCTDFDDVEKVKPVVLAGVNINVGTARQPALGVGGSGTSPIEIAPNTENVLIGGVDTPAIESMSTGSLTIRSQDQGAFATASLYLGAGVVSEAGGDMAIAASVEFLAGGADHLRVTARATGEHAAFCDVVYIEEGCQTCFDLGGDAGLGFWVQGNDEVEGGDSLARIRGGYFAQGEVGTALNPGKGSLGSAANLNILAKDPRMRVVPSSTVCDNADIAERYPYAVTADPGAFEVEGEGEGEWTYDIAGETLTITRAPKGGNLTVSPAAWVPSGKMQSALVRIDAGEGNDAYVTINGVHLDNGYTRSKSSFEVVSGAAHITVEGKNVLKAFPNERNRSAAAALQSNTNALFLDGTGELNVSAEGGAGIGSAAGKPVGDITIGGSVTVNATSLQNYWWSNAGAAIGGGAHTIHATNGSVGRIFIGGDATVYVKSGHEYYPDKGEYGAGIGAGRGFGYSGTVVIAGGHLTFDTDTPFSCNNVVLQGGVFDCAVSGDGKIHGKAPASGYKAVERTLDEGYRSQVVPENFEQGSLTLIGNQTYVYGSDIVPKSAQDYIKGSTPSGTLAVATYATKTGVDADGNPTFSEYQDGVPRDAGAYRVKIALPYAVSFGRIYTGIWKTVDVTIEQRPLRGLVWHDTENRFENDGLRAWVEPQGVLEGDDVSVWVEEYPSPSNGVITFYASGLLGEDADNYRFADDEALELSAPLGPPPYGIDLALLNHEGVETSEYTYGDTVYVSAQLENPEPGTMSMYYRGDCKGELLDGPVTVDENGACSLSYDTARKIIKPTDPGTLDQNWRDIVVTFTPEGDDAPQYSWWDSFALNRRDVDICIESVDDRVFNGANGDWSCSNLVWGLDGVLSVDEGKVSYHLGNPHSYAWSRGNVGSSSIYARSSYDGIEGESVEFYKLKDNPHKPGRDEGLDSFEYRTFTPKNGAKVVQGEMGAPPAPVVTAILSDAITVQNHKAPSQITYDINGVEYGIREPGGQWRWEHLVNDWKVETVTFDNLAGGTIYEIGMRYAINGNWYYGDNPISSTICCTAGGKGENYFKFDPPTADDYRIDYAAETMAFDEAYLEMNTAEDFSGEAVHPGALTGLLDSMEPGDRVSLYLRAAAFGNKNASDRSRWF